ncbi:MAG: hypothetical protein IJZ08_00440 [Clostridia bacterium]|nr:hypothetical protein [Clostridia bacterium]
MSDIRNIAALAMLTPDAKEAERLQADMENILAMGKTMPAPTGANSVSHAVTADALREDTARPYEDSAALTALSKKERDGCIAVSRTVGGES